MNFLRYRRRSSKDLLAGLSSTIESIQKNQIDFFVVDYTGRMYRYGFRDTTLKDLQGTVPRKYWTKYSRIWKMNHSLAVCMILFLYILYTEYSKVRLLHDGRAEVMVNGVPQRVSYLASFA